MSASAMLCPDCGASYNEEDEFCGVCGRRLGADTSSSELTGSPSVEDRPTTVRQPGMRPYAPPQLASQLPRSSLKQPLITGAVLVLLMGLGVLAAVIVSGIVRKAAVGPPGTVPAQGELLYQDDFRDPASSWDAWDDGGTSGKYFDGAYRLAVKLENYMAWSHPAVDREFKDFVIEVDARQTEGSLDSTFGPIVRLQTEEEHYYWFQISGDGYYSVEKKWEGEWILLQPWEASDAINQGLDALNQIRVTCYGDRFSFYVNGTHLADVTDDTVRAGIIGLAAGAYTEPPVTVLFDNVSVYQLGD